MAENEKDFALARKYRTTTLEGYVGNEYAKNTLIRYLKRGKKPQSILIWGNSGCGKTTLTRVIAKIYMCESPLEDGMPCGECTMCQYFDEYIRTGESEDIPDMYEIDSSDKSGKKDIDSMLSGMEYPPMASDWKIYFLDEAHLLSEGAMGRLLKSLEEPPEGVLFILSTTDPERLLPTIKNRCQLKLPITKPKTKEIVDFLQKVCLNEGKDYDLQGLRMLAVRNENVVRDSLNGLETVLNTYGDAKSNSVSSQFKEVADKLIFDFYTAYINKNYLDYINILYNIKTMYSLDRFLVTLTNFTVRGIYILNSVDVDGISEEELSSYVNLFKQFSPGDIARILSELKKMNIGDVEANLMAFIYCDSTRGTPIEESPSVNIVPTDVSNEAIMRNSNLQRIEATKLSEGSKSVRGEFDKVGFDGLTEMFNLEKVTD